MKHLMKCEVVQEPWADECLRGIMETEGVARKMGPDLSVIVENILPGWR